MMTSKCSLPCERHGMQAVYTPCRVTRASRGDHSPQQARCRALSGRCDMFGSSRPLQRCQQQQSRRRLALLARAGTVSPGQLVLVVGATGGVGQLATAKLLEGGFKVRAVVRDRQKAEKLLGSRPDLELAVADCRERSQVDGITRGVDAVLCCTGTTAFPSKRWAGNNGPEQTDYVAVKNVIEATPKGVQRFVLTTSAGVDRQGQIPFSILNLFGVLKHKARGEQLLRASGLPWTILRPSRLTDGPYTSYDLNTLLQATAGTRREVQLSAKDDQLGEASRISVAEAMVQSLLSARTEGRALSIASVEGEGPGSDQAAWDKLFAAVA